MIHQLRKREKDWVQVDRYESVKILIKRQSEW